MLGAKSRASAAWRSVTVAMIVMSTTGRAVSCKSSNSALTSKEGSRITLEIGTMRGGVVESLASAFEYRTPMLPQPTTLLENVPFCAALIHLDFDGVEALQKRLIPIL